MGAFLLGVGKLIFIFVIAESLLLIVGFVYALVRMNSFVSVITAHEQFCERNYCARSGEYLPFTLVEYPLQKLVVSPSLMACLVSSVTVVEACTRFIGKMKNICIHGER